MKAKQLTKIITDYILSEQSAIQEHEQISTILKANEGNKLNWRTKLPEGLKLDVRYNMWHIKGEFSHLVSYDGLINSEAFENYDSCCGNAARERLTRMNEILQPETFAKLLKTVSKIERLYKELSEATAEIKTGEFRSYTNPVYYQIFGAIMPENVRRELT